MNPGSRLRGLLLRRLEPSGPGGVMLFFAWIGAISYSPYLFHSPVDFVFKHPLSTSVPPHAVAAPVALVSLVVAWTLEAWLPAKLRALPVRVPVPKPQA